MLDWELAFLGNPANDVAYQAFTHAFLGVGCPSLEGCPSVLEWKHEYERVSVRELADWDYFYAVATFKVHTQEHVAGVSGRTAGNGGSKARFTGFHLAKRTGSAGEVPQLNGSGRWKS